jgi:hypothetical protein
MPLLAAAFWLLLALCWSRPVSTAASSPPRSPYRSPFFALDEAAAPHGDRHGSSPGAAAAQLQQWLPNCYSSTGAQYATPLSPVAGDGTFASSVVFFVSGSPPCRYFSVQVNIDSQFVIATADSTRISLTIWRADAASDANAVVSSLVYSPNSDGYFFNSATSMPALNSSSCAGGGRTCAFIICISLAQSTPLSVGQQVATRVRGAVGRRLAFGAAPIADSLASVYGSRFFAVSVVAADLPARIRMTPLSFTGNNLVQTLLYVFPVKKPFTQLYPNAPHYTFPVTGPATEDAHIQNDPNYYADGIYLAEIAASPSAVSNPNQFSIQATRNIPAQNLKPYVPPQQAQYTFGDYLGYQADLANSSNDMARKTMFVALAAIGASLLTYLCIAWYRHRLMQMAVLAAHGINADSDDDEGDDEDEDEEAEGNGDNQDAVARAARRRERRAARRRRRRREALAAQQAVARGCTREEIAQLPTLAYTRGVVPDEDATCSICIGEYVAGEVLRQIGCGHHFHLECLDPWLATSKVCPLCQQNIADATNVHAAACAHPAEASAPHAAEARRECIEIDMATLTASRAVHLPMQLVRNPLYGHENGGDSAPQTASARVPRHTRPAVIGNTISEDASLNANLPNTVAALRDRPASSLSSGSTE